MMRNFYTQSRVSSPANKGTVKLANRLVINAKI